MNDYRQKIKQQGSIAIGVALIFTGVVLLGLFIFFLFRTKKNTDLFSDIIYAVSTLVVLIFGIITLINGIKGRRVIIKGKISTCKIIDIIPAGKGSRTYKISYIGESGQEHIVSVYQRIPNEELEIDDILECSINGEDCYVYMRKVNKEE